jgi:predicted TIM-barrel fold metal-dependent hydrolase
MQGTPKEHEVVVKWSQFPNTVMKLSSVPEKRQYPHRDVAPIIKQLTDAFGADRLIYGGGFSDTASGESYRKERERIAGYLGHMSKEDWRGSSAATR